MSAPSTISPSSQTEQFSYSERDGNKIGQFDPTKELAKPPLPISHEFDLTLSQHHGDPNIDRSDWLQRVLQNNPEVRQIRECVNPVVRAASFARLYLPPNRLIPHELLLALISQHLRTLGLSRSQESLHSEWGADFAIPPHKLYSQLAFLVQRGIHRAERFWELAIPSIHSLDTLKATQAALDEEISRTIGAAPNILEDKTPITEEVNGDEQFIRFDPNTNELVEASLNQLIYYVTTYRDNQNCAELVSALCLTISSYASSKIFFTKIKDRMMQVLAAKPEINPEDPESKATYDQWYRESLMVFKLFKEWIKGAANDLEPQIHDAAVQFVDNYIIPNFPANLCRNLFEGRGDGVANRLMQIESKAAPVELGNCIPGLWKGKFSLLDLPYAEFARQLTVWSSNRYYSIKRCELLDCAWDKPRLRYRAPNVIALTAHFNRMSQWAQYQILIEPDLQKRLTIMRYLIDLCKSLFEMRNYFDAYAIYLVFESNAIFRLNVHKSLLSESYTQVLSDIGAAYDSTDSNAALRKLYETALNSNKPVLPYIGVLLSDLFKYYDGVQTFVNNLINVRKCRGVYKMIHRIEEFKRDQFCFLPIDQVQSKIDELPDYDDDTLFEMSMNVEKTGAQTEADLKGGPAQAV